MKPRFFSVILILCLVAGQFTHAATLRVRQDGQGGAFTSVKAAVEAATAGDSIEIEQFTGPFEETTMFVRDLAIRCTNAQPATLHFDVGNGFEWLVNSSLENLHIEGNDRPGTRNYVAGSFLIDNCQFTRWGWGALDIYQGAGYGTSGVISNTYLIGSFLTVALRNDAGTPGTESDALPILFDHVTLVTGQYAMALAGIGDQSTITIKNTIITVADPTADTQGYVLFLDKEEVPLSVSYDNAQLSFNNFYAPVGSILQTGTHTLHPGDVEGDPLFTDPAVGNYSLRAGSPLVGAGEGGSNIGAWQGTVVAPSGSRGWSLFQ